MIRVLLVDDHPMVRAGLEAILRLEPGLVPVGTAEDGRELIAKVRRARPDVVVMDLRLPGDEDGLALCRALRREPAPPAVLLYCADTGEWLTRAAGEAGAAGVVDKTADPRELLDAIRIAARGYASPEPAS
jgi:DNA-binding NarL/FixJ family response regulator